MPAEQSGCVFKYTVVVLMVSGNEQNMPEIRERVVDEAHDAIALIDAVLVRSHGIEAPGVTEIPGDDENISFW